MNNPVVFMFSGQGSQYYQMGVQLYSDNPRFKHWMDRCDAVFEPYIDNSIVDIIYQGGNKTDSFDRLLHTNAALLSFQYSLAKVLIEEGHQPDLLLGYSLGEFVAAVVSESMTLEDGAKLVSEYAKFLEKTPATYGSMLSVLDCPSIMERYPDCFLNCEVIGKNFDKNFVISGDPNAICLAEAKLKDKDVLTQKLPVNFAFHTQLFEPIKAQFFSLGEQLSFSAPVCPAVSCFSTENVPQFSMNHFWSVTRNPIQFRDTLKKLVDKGDFLFVDLSPSGTLSTFVRYLLGGDTGSETITAMTPFGKDMETLEKVKARLTSEIGICY